MPKLYTDAHQKARSTGKQEFSRYNEKFRPLVKDYASDAIGWDSQGRRQFNQDRANISTRLGLRDVLKSAGANRKSIIKGGILGGKVMADATVSGDRVTDWQKLDKLTKSAGHFRSLQNVTDANMQRFGNLESDISRTQSQIKEAIKDMKYGFLGQVAGVGAGYAAGGGWWGGSPDTSSMVDGAGGGYGADNIGSVNFRNMINGDQQYVS